jgi:hypothetical protein
VSIEEELPRLFDELADNHIVGPPPKLVRHIGSTASHARARPALRATAAVAACSVVLIGGLVAIGTRNNDAAPANSPNTTPSASSQLGTSIPSAPATESTLADTSADGDAGEAIGLDLDLIRIDARATGQGTTHVVLAFDGDIPSADADLVEDITTPPSDRVGYLTQSSPSGISVCGSTHSFPSPGNRTVDIFVPSDWFSPTSAIDPPIEWDPDSVTQPKIVVCPSQNGVVQISVWGAASGRAQDVDVTVDARTIIADIAVDPTNPPDYLNSGVVGPVMRHPQQAEIGEEQMAAEVRGVLELEQDCLYVALDEVGERYPILWPSSTTWDFDTNTVVLPSGESIAIGDSVYGGGGYLYVDDIERLAGKEAAELAARCVDNDYGEIAVVNNADSAIAPG